jgi:parallel beta-helix repeat protein
MDYRPESSDATQSYGMKIYRGLAVILACLLLASAAASGVTAGSSVNSILDPQDTAGERTDYVLRAPIAIDGNEDFARQAAGEGWPGDGSVDEPYVIEGYEIDGSGHGYGIYIRNSTVHFVVTGCYLHSASGGRYDGEAGLGAGRDSGLYLRNVQNARLEHNALFHNDGSGIYLHFSDSNIISHNMAHSNAGDGISILLSDQNTAFSNALSSNLHGISIGSSTDNTITSNAMTLNGVFLSGDQLEHLNTHNIDSSNMVNGKPVYHIKDWVGGTVPEGAGQVILVNCRGVIVENQTISDVSLGISVLLGGGNAISNNTVSVINEGWGIEVFRSDGNIIASNRVQRHDTPWRADAGILVWDSNSNVVIGNDISGFRYGIFLENRAGDAGNRADHNIFSENERDIVQAYFTNGNNHWWENAIHHAVLIFLPFALTAAILFVIWRKKEART